MTHVAATRIHVGRSLVLEAGDALRLDEIADLIGDAGVQQLLDGGDIVPTAADAAPDADDTRFGVDSIVDISDLAPQTAEWLTARNADELNAARILGEWLEGRGRSLTEISEQGLEDGNLLETLNIQCPRPEGGRRGERERELSILLAVAKLRSDPKSLTQSGDVRTSAIETEATLDDVSADERDRAQNIVAAVIQAGDLTEREAGE